MRRPHARSRPATGHRRQGRQAGGLPVAPPLPDRRGQRRDPPGAPARSGSETGGTTPRHAAVGGGVAIRPHDPAGTIATLQFPADVPDRG